MDTEQEDYKKDPRFPCMFGRKCYQKNPLHHNKYKHPPDPKRKKEFKNNDSPKRAKPNEPSSNSSKIVQGNATNPFSKASNNELEQSENGVEDEEKPVKFSNNVSDSDSESGEDLGSIKPREKPIKESDKLIDQKNILKPTTATPSLVCDHKNGHYNEIGKTFIKEKFLLEMPEDFYRFYELCERLNKSNPTDALSGIGLKLVGPFDVLCGKFCGIDKQDADYLIHWRYYYDPPQMQTVLKGDDKTGYHIGYFRDSPEDKPVFMVENYGMKDGTLTVIGENIFAAVSLYIEDKKKTADPFRKLTLNKIANVVKEEAEKLGLDLTRTTKNMSKRNNKVLTRTFNKIGLVVPYERKTQLGYRKLALSDKELEALLTKIQRAKADQKQKVLGDLQAQLLTWTDIATDECDFGTGIELGWDIIGHGLEDLNHTAAQFLASSFRQLKWDAFAKIAEAHMANRKKTCSLSVL